MKIIEKNYKWNGSLSKRQSTKRLILHHAESSNCTSYDIHQWHVKRGGPGLDMISLLEKMDRYIVFVQKIQLGLMPVVQTLIVSEFVLKENL